MDILKYFNVRKAENAAVITVEKFIKSSQYSLISDEQIIILKDSIDNIKVIARLDESDGVVPHKSDTRDYSEIIFLEVVLKEFKDFIRIPTIIFHAILYPVVVIMRYNNKIKICTCRIHDNKKNSNLNTVPKPAITHWIYPHNLSLSATNFLSKLDIKNTSAKDIWETYTHLHQQILCFGQRALSRASAERLIDYLGGGGYKKALSEFCTYTELNNQTSISNKYRKQYSDTLLKYQFDFEDIWQYIMTNDYLWQAVRNLGIENMEMLLYRYEEYRDRYSVR